MMNFSLSPDLKKGIGFSESNQTKTSFINRLVLSFALLFLLILIKPALLQAQNETITPGSFVIDMGVVPQTVGNGLKPYGMIYDLIANFEVPIKWVIAPGKVKDGVDFTYNGYDFKGGPFIILAEYRSTAVNARITYWQGQGVVGVTTTAPITVPVAMTLVVSSVPRWTLDLLNGSLAIPYFTNAGIPASAYNAPKTNPKLPSALGYCDDIFVMPHAYPQWSTHSNLYVWNKTYHGSIWLSCTAGSELEDMVNLADATHTEQTNFLTEKNPAIAYPTGTVTTVQNALWLYNNHTAGTPPYTYTNAGDMFMQFMGPIDAATQNGLEQVYIPMAPGWRAYGRGFGDSNRGYVMIEAAHSLNTAQLPPNIAAQRVFFNFSFMSGKDATILPNLAGIPTSFVSGTASPVSFTYPPGINPSEFHIKWFSSCGGTFVADPVHPGDSTRMIFNPPSVPANTFCPITVSIKDACDRIFNTSKTSLVTCDMQVTTTLTNACNGASDGKITMAITGAGPAYNWSWTKSGGGSGSGTGTVISGLAAGTYTVTVTSGGGAGCARTFTVTISSSPAIAALVATPVDVICHGLSTGTITLADASGGTPPFTYLWGDGPTVQSRTGLAAGTYSVTASDANGCAVSATGITINQPTGMTITPTITPINCFGQSTGAISLVVSGGNGSITYAWNDGVTTKDRTGLAAGTYSVAVTDASNCTQTQSGIVVSQPSAGLGLSASVTNVGCNGASTGAIDLTVTGGTTAYGYDWGGGVTTEDRTGLAAGDYSVTVTDHNGCTAVLAKTVTQGTAVVASTTVTNQTCPGANDGRIVLSATGGTGTYTYQIDGGGYGATHDFAGLTAGSHTVMAKDGNGCTASVIVSVGTTNRNPVAPASIN